MSAKQSCNDWQDLLPAYHNERLGGDDRAALAAHLATCANCQSALVQC
jgi:anti-sigma factor RsiW